MTDAEFQRWLKKYKEDNFLEYSQNARTSLEERSYHQRLRRIADREHNKGKFRTIMIWGFVVALIIALVFIGSRDSANTYSDEGDGVINIFGINNEAKNYRVNAFMSLEVTPRGFYSQKKVYDINTIQWPNGGTTDFEECTVIPTENINTCIDNEWREWRIEIHQDPERT